MTASNRLSVVAEVLASRRDEVLSRWLQAARAQPFHRVQPDDADTEHIGAVVDALVELLRRYASGDTQPGVPLKDAATLSAARAHAMSRFAQGMGAPAIVTEFRLLREAIEGSLREQPANAVLPTDVVGVEQVMRDALDGAVLHALEARRRDPGERRVSSAATASDELLRLVVERVEDYAIFVLDPNGRVATWNAGAQRIKGYTSDEIIGLPYATFFCPEDRDAGKPERLLHRARIDGRVEDEGWRLRKDGSRFWADAVLTALYDARGRLRGYAKVTRDLTERRRAEEQILLNTALRELAEERERFAASFNQATVGIAQRDLTGRFMLVNDRFCELVRRSRDELLQLKDLDITHPDDRAPNARLLTRLLERGEVYTIEKRYVCPDGSPVWVNSSVSLIRDASGAPRFVLGVSIDVTDRRRAEQATRLRSDLIEAAHEAIFAWETQDGVTFWNRGAEELYGYTAAEALGRRSHDLLGTSPAQVATLLAALERDGRWEGELCHVTKDGRRITVESRLALVGGDGRRHVLEATRDVTEQRQAEAALRASEARAAMLAEASRVLGSSLDYQTTLANMAQLAVPHLADWCTVDLLDENGELRRLSVAHADPAKVRLAEELRRRYLLDPNAAIGPVQVVRTGEPELVPEIPEELVERGARDAEHLTLLRGLGLRSYMVVPVWVRDQIMGAISFVSAESGRRFAPDDLAVAEELARRAAVAIENARLYQQAQEAIRVRDDFFAAASHDLKNPLASIRGNAQVLLRTLDRTGAVPPQRLTSALSNVVGSIDQMTRLIDDLLDVARLRLGEPLPLDRVATDLVALTGRAVAAQQAATERHQLATRTPEAELVGEWDAARLERVLGNLLSNAIKYSPNGGEITVSLRLEAGQAVLTVQDSGIGIPAADLPRVFERFERARNAVGRIGGSGIGLAASKQIVEQHGGTIAVESREGQGSAFTVRLPLTPPSPTEVARKDEPYTS